MKKLIIVLLCLTFGTVATMAQDAKAKTKKAGAETSVTVVETSCGQCQFGLDGGGCSLAVRMDGKAYFVDGSNLEDHGDAHASDGMCMKIRKAEVEGEVVGDRFQAKSIRLIAEEKE